MTVGGSWFFVILFTAVLTIFHLVAVSFLIPGLLSDFSLSGRIWGFVLVGGFSLIADIVCFRFMKDKYDSWRRISKANRRDV